MNPIIRKVVLILLVGITTAIVACEQDVQETWSAKVASPDNKWIALGRSEQHFGPGNAAVVTSVSLAPVSKQKHEEPVLDFLDNFSASEGPTKVKMRWLNSTHLDIALSRHPDVNLQVVRYGDIDISVHESAQQ
jgi:hypothetical protein